jgi:hypothetical protein
LDCYSESRVAGSALSIGTTPLISSYCVKTIGMVVAVLHVQVVRGRRKLDSELVELRLAVECP